MASAYLSRTFWARTAERAIKTAAQVLPSVLGADALTSAFDLPWRFSLGVTLTAVIASVCTSIASAPAGDDPEDPSLV